MSILKKSIITDVHLQEAATLKSLWDMNRSRRTQSEFGAHYGLGSQTNIGHYLLGRSPLNLRSASAFAAELKCDISDFSPRLASDRLQLGGPISACVNESNPLEWKLLNLFRELTTSQQELLFTVIEAAHKHAKRLKQAP